MALRQVRMAAAQPSRHTVRCGGWLFLGPSLSEICCGAPRQRDQGAEGDDDERSRPLGSREMPLILAALGSALVLAFYRHVASGPIARLVTAALWVAALVLTARVSCRDPGVLPRAWQVTQCPRLSDQVERLVHSNQTTAGARVCATCCVVRPTGASHCATCDACIAGFDHHCCWLGACIGERNHADFMLLLYHGVLCGAFATVQCAAVLLGPTPHAGLVRAPFSQGGYAHGLIMSLFAMFSGHFDYIFLRLRYPLDSMFNAVLVHPALGYGVLGALVALWYAYRVVSGLLQLTGVAWLGTAGRMNVCFGGVLMLLMAAVCFPFIYFLFDEAWELHSKVPVTEAQVVAAVIALLLIAILPMWIAFTMTSSQLVSRNISRKSWLKRHEPGNRGAPPKTLLSDEEWQTRMKGLRGRDNGEVPTWRRLVAFLSRPPPPTILGQRGGWGAFVRMDEAEIAAANRLASDRADDLTAVATGGGAVVRNVGGGGQRKRTLVQAKLVGAPDRSMPVYAADGTTVPPPPLRIV